ncbi:hypothetical protein HGT70_15625 [Rosenbergiella collisarenosi]|uniref:hypothetical protein n=1 Tax=Rosenbergiella collisarenosi TaxID=1544695 RepID=UPI001BDA6F20|nr:hypothetical protein [Rosenbergiella collisarenosi]MBT0722692.1 hypothetical protein [Rosenbergiella collisarenosi]
MSGSDHGFCLGKTPDATTGDKAKLVGDFDFDRNNLIRGTKISIGCGIIIGVGQCFMSKEKPASPFNPK